MVRSWSLLCIMSLLAGASPSFAQSGMASLREGFLHPPDAAKPRTWWHWTGGNVTLTGITKDLEWMKSAGIGGEQLSDVSYGYGQTVPDKLIFGSPAWLNADPTNHSAIKQMTQIAVGILD